MTSEISSLGYACQNIFTRAVTTLSYATALRSCCTWIFLVKLASQKLICTCVAHGHVTHVTCHVLLTKFLFLPRKLYKKKLRVTDLVFPELCS